MRRANELHKCYFCLQKQNKTKIIILYSSTINDVLWNQFYISSRQINKYASLRAWFLSLWTQNIYLFGFSFFFWIRAMKLDDDNRIAYTNKNLKINIKYKKITIFCAHANIYIAITAAATAPIEKSTWKRSLWFILFSMATLQFCFMSDPITFTIHIR